MVRLGLAPDAGLTVTGAAAVPWPPLTVSDGYVPESSCTVAPAGAAATAVGSEHGAAVEHVDPVPVGDAVRVVAASAATDAVRMPVRTTAAASVAAAALRRRARARVSSHPEAMGLTVRQNRSCR
ncbi:hypothetical protein GCM10022287_08240 [Gryllotalpicola koreensis]|uniref:Uncharacterized protein n=1 Tax=Gryllotalpicola koreensis TaxID=993086 RepID=A0ABP7ZTY2_9MICO